MFTGANAGNYTGTLSNVTSRNWNCKSGYVLLDINAAGSAADSIKQCSRPALNAVGANIFDPSFPDNEIR